MLSLVDELGSISISASFDALRQKLKKSASLRYPLSFFRLPETEQVDLKGATNVLNMIAGAAGERWEYGYCA